MINLCSLTTSSDDPLIKKLLSNHLLILKENVNILPDIFDLKHL